MIRRSGLQLGLFAIIYPPSSILYPFPRLRPPPCTNSVNALLSIPCQSEGNFPHFPPQNPKPQKCIARPCAKTRNLPFNYGGFPCAPTNGSARSRRTGPTYRLRSISCHFWSLSVTFPRLQ